MSATSIPRSLFVVMVPIHCDISDLILMFYSRFRGHGAYSLLFWRSDSDVLQPL